MTDKTDLDKAREALGSDVPIKTTMGQRETANMRALFSIADSLQRIATLLEADAKRADAERDELAEPLEQWAKRQSAGQVIPRGWYGGGGGGGSSTAHSDKYVHQRETARLSGRDPVDMEHDTDAEYEEICTECDGTNGDHYLSCSKYNAR